MTTPHPKADLIKILEGLSDRAYCDYIAKMRTNECLGWEEKVRTSKFGQAELNAHTKAGELLGRHRAFAEAAAAAWAMIAPLKLNGGEAGAALSTAAQPQASLPTVEQVEDSMGMGHGAWDMVDPNELIKAIVTLAAAPKAAPTSHDKERK